MRDSPHIQAKLYLTELLFCAPWEMTHRRRNLFCNCANASACWTRRHCAIFRRAVIKSNASILLQVRLLSFAKINRNFNYPADKRVSQLELPVATCHETLDSMSSQQNQKRFIGAQEVRDNRAVVLHRLVIRNRETLRHQPRQTHPRFGDK